MPRRDNSDTEGLVIEEELSENSDTTGNDGGLAMHDRDRLAPSRGSSTNISRVSSVGDLPNQEGNTGKKGNQAGIYRELVVHGEGLPEQVSRAAWEVNYREAAIFLDEGENNDKFLHHPRDIEALPAYLLVHSTWFNVIDFAASIVILGLGLCERPCIPALQVPVPIHGSIELCGLLLLSVQLALKTRWIGFRSCLQHKRTLIKMTSLCIMIVEAVVVLVRQKNHFRVTRALRPLFLLDTHFAGGVRRFIRQILQSLPPILDMMSLLLFIMVIYSVIGFYLFGPTIEHPGSPYFKTLLDSFINLFVLLTTANYPDVMMPSYADNKFASAFFISYLAINLYFLMNLMLAVVYDAFTAIEVGKFKKLFLHKRKACQHAFKLLVTRDSPREVNFQHFSGLISFFNRASSPMDRLLMFKILAKEGADTISQEDFYQIYDAVLYRWRPTRVCLPYYESCRAPLATLLRPVRTLVTSRLFDLAIYLIITCNGLLLVVHTYMLTYTDKIQEVYAFWVAYMFIGIYTLELALKLLGLGFAEYFGSPWNCFDFLVTLSGLISIILTELHIPAFYIVILRPLRLLRLFRLKKRFRDVFGTFVILLPRLYSAIIVLILVYYFYGIIGIELFHGLDDSLRNCCKNSTVEPYYNYNENSSGIGYFYLNNFESLPVAGVTLFELTVVNNWFVIMEGYAVVAGEWSRLYFMSFYLLSMVVMTIIVAFILEAFLFRIQYKQTMNKEDEIKKLTVTVKVNREELITLDQNYYTPNQRGVRQFTVDTFNEEFMEFTGYKRRTKEELQKLMYRKEMLEWLEEAEEEDRRRLQEFSQAVLVGREDSGQRIQVEDSDSELDLTLTRQIISH